MAIGKQVKGKEHVYKNEIIYAEYNKNIFFQILNSETESRFKCF